MSDENFDGDEGFKSLRKAYDEQKSQLAELQKTLAAVAEKERAQSLTQIFEAKGLRSSAATHYSGEVSEDAVLKWATDLGLLAGETDNDANSEAARRTVQASDSSQSLLGKAQASQSNNGKAIVGDPHKMLELVKTKGFSYEQGVELGIFPENPHTV